MVFIVFLLSYSPQIMAWKQKDGKNYRVLYTTRNLQTHFALLELISAVIVIEARSTIQPLFPFDKPRIIRHVMPLV